MGRTAVEVVAQFKTIVNPKNGAPYVRRSMNTVRSPGLKAFNSCIRRQLGGKHFPNREAAMAGFANATASCRGPGPGSRRYAALPAAGDTAGRRMGRRY